MEESAVEQKAIIYVSHVSLSLAALSCDVEPIISAHTVLTTSQLMRVAMQKICLSFRFNGRSRSHFCETRNVALNSVDNEMGKEAVRSPS
jgi:hypothetical protein